MNIVVAGASGFVGTALTRSLISRGHTVIGLGTSASHPVQSETGCRWLRADTTQPGDWQKAIREADAVVNLTGRTIFKRWTPSYKAQIVDSRILTTRNIVKAMRRENQVLVSASAVGFYGDRGEKSLSEEAAPGDDFLARLSVDWENAALEAKEHGVRVAIMRLAVVLGVGGGALEQMLPVFRRFAGGPLGSGRQWFPWIHMTDLIGIVHYLIGAEHAMGVYNASAPGAIRQADFAHALGAVLGRPAVVPAPALALRLMMGAVSGVLLASQKVHPQRLIADGFDFRFPDAPSALADLVGQS